jgi:hypothetical protein
MASTNGNVTEQLGRAIGNGQSPGLAPIHRHQQADRDDEQPRERTDRRIEALATEIVRADDPAEMRTYILARLDKVLAYRFELLFSRFRMPDIHGKAEAERLAFLEIISGNRDHS